MENKGKMKNKKNKEKKQPTKTPENLVKVKSSNNDISLSQEEYIKSKINVVFQPMIAQMVITQPKEPIKYMIDWLLKFSGEKQNNNLKNELNFLRKVANSKATSNIEYSSDSSNDNSDDEYDPDIVAFRNKLLLKNPRISVSAEVYGIFNPEKFLPISSNGIQEIGKFKEILKKNFILGSLNEKDLELVIKAMKVKKFKKLEIVIKEGEEGNDFYVVESGILECFKHDKLIKTYEKNDSFGELALLYYTPRQATIIAKTDSVLLSLDRITFTQIVKDNAIKRKEICKQFLKSVPILSNFSQNDINQILEAVRIKKYIKGEYIIKQNEDGNYFYILESGEVEAIKNGKKVKSYIKGEYFGELALLKEGDTIKRAADILVVSDECCVLELDKKSFKRLLGPIEEVLQNNMNIYK